MAEFKFSCPGCGQHIQLDELWRGHQIQCPSCQTETTVPQAQAPAAPAVPAGGPRLARSAAPAATAQAATGTRFTAQRVPGRGQAPAKKPWMKWAAIGAAVLALGAGGIYGIPYILAMQDKANADRRANAKNADGGEMGHTMELYKVLDATEPGGPGLGGRPQGHGPSRREMQMDFPVTPNRNTETAAVPSLPILPAVWTLDPLPSSIPEGRANGMLAGTNFLVETARVDPVGTALVLRLIQGALISPDRELMIYLHLKAGETLSGHSWKISKDMTTGVPEVKKRWKTDPKYAPQLKSIPNGYALQLELGDITNATVSGKIFLALPDPEKSVVAGFFNAAIMTAGPVTPMAGTPMAAPMAPRPGPRTAADAAYEQRYGRPR